MRIKFFNIVFGNDTSKINSEYQLDEVIAYWDDGDPKNDGASFLSEETGMAVKSFSFEIEQEH